MMQSQYHQEKPPKIQTLIIIIMISNCRFPESIEDVDARQKLKKINLKVKKAKLASQRIN